MSRDLETSAQGDAGFTLLELLIVIATLSLLSLAAMPASKRTQRNVEVQAAAAGIASAMRLTRADAIRANKDISVILDLNWRQIRTQSQARPGKLPGAVAIRYDVPAAEHIKPGVAAFRFYHDGSSSGGSIVLKSSSRTAKISVDWLTGETRLDWRR